MLPGDQMMKTQEVAISELKRNCFRLVQRVSETRQSIRVTRFGRPLADVVPPAEPKVDRSAWIGSGKGTAKILGDIVSPPNTKSRSLVGLKPASG